MRAGQCRITTQHPKVYANTLGKQENISEEFSEPLALPSQSALLPLLSIIKIIHIVIQYFSGNLYKLISIILRAYH